MPDFGSDSTRASLQCWFHLVFVTPACMLETDRQVNSVCTCISWCVSTCVSVRFPNSKAVQSGDSVVVGANMSLMLDVDLPPLKELRIEGQ